MRSDVYIILNRDRDIDFLGLLSKPSDRSNAMRKTKKKKKTTKERSHEGITLFVESLGQMFTTAKRRTQRDDGVRQFLT